MLMPQADRKKIYAHLFEHGACIAKKDYELKSHPDIEGVKNLYVVKEMKSLLSREYVKEQYNWRHYYFMLTGKGICYLRNYLGLPESHVPAPQRQEPRTRTRAPKFGGADEGRGDGEGGGPDKTAEVGPGAVQPQRGGPPKPPAVDPLQLETWRR